MAMDLKKFEELSGYSTSSCFKYTSLFISSLCKLSLAEVVHGNQSQNFGVSVSCNVVRERYERIKTKSSYVHNCASGPYRYK